MAAVGFNMGKQLATLTYHRPDLHQVVAGQSTWRSAAHGTNSLICLPPWSSTGWRCRCLMLLNAPKDEIRAKQVSSRAQNSGWSLGFYLLTPILVILPLQFLPQNSCFALAIKVTFTLYNYSQGSRK